MSRARAPHERQRDADRSRQRLIAAALEEFAARGYAGARVRDIAARAGLNKQLIAYYFGGKDGLYRAVQELWLEQEATFADPDLPLDELIAGYLHAALTDPRMGRLLIWEGLAEVNDDSERPPAAPASAEDLAELRRRQAQGELADDLDVGSVMLALMGAVLLPAALPQMVRRVTGLEPGDPDFERRYTEQLKRMVRHLAG